MRDGDAGGATDEFQLVNEFARIVVRQEASNGPVLTIRDVRSGASIQLDPLELEALAFSTHEDLGALMDPGRLTGG